MVLGAGLERVVGDLVIIPDTNEGVGLVNCLQIRIRPVQAITHAVVFQRHYFVFRLNIATLFQHLGVGITAFGVLVNVITQVQHCIAVARSQFAIDIEVALGIIGAGNHGQPGLCHAGRWQCTGASHRTDHAFHNKAVEIGKTGLKPASINLYRKISVGTCLSVSGRQHVIKALITGYLPLNIDSFRPPAARQHPGPEDDAILQRITTGNAMGKVCCRRCMDRQAANR